MLVTACVCLLYFPWVFRFTIHWFLCQQSDEEFLASLRTRSAAMSVSVPRSEWPRQPSRPAQSKTTARLQRSQSCRYPRYRHVTHHPPTVRTFVLDFHCEVDETRGLVYGTGGALLTTIRRVIRQLVHLQRLSLTDLFLTVTDARNLLLDITKVTHWLCFSLFVFSQPGEVLFEMEVRCRLHHASWIA